MAKNLESRVESAVISYNLLPAMFYPSYWLARPRTAPLTKKYAKFKNPPIPIGTIYKNGAKEGKISRFVRPGDPGKAFYGAAYTLGETADPIVEWAQDPTAERDANNDQLPFGRKTALAIHPLGGNRITMSQQNKSFFDSWYGLPFKLPAYIASLPLNIGRLFGKRELVELGSLYEIEGLPDGSDTKLDENYIKRILTLGLGKYFDVRDQNTKKLFTINRSVLIKLFSLGLKNSYKIKFYRDNNQEDYKSAIGITDYLNREWQYRMKKPPKGLSLENIFDYN